MELTFLRTGMLLDLIPQAFLPRRDDRVRQQDERSEIGSKEETIGFVERFLQVPQTGFFSGLVEQLNQQNLEEQFNRQTAP